MMEGEVDWAPTQHMGHTILSTFQIASNLERNTRYVRRRKHPNAPELTAALIITDQEDLDSNSYDVEMELSS